jgi:basic membrane lipoprotein Med (substrate-binding protein (PBP1-ABC) superfamily)
VIHQANDQAQGVFDACKEKGVYAFGANADQNSNPSGVVLGSAVIIARPAYVDLAKRVKEGTYKGEVTLMGMSDHAIDFAFNPSLVGKVPQALQAKIEDLRKQITEGTLIVPKDEF